MRSPGKRGPHGGQYQGVCRRERGPLHPDKISDSWMPLGISKGWDPLRSLCLGSPVTVASQSTTQQAAGRGAGSGGLGWGGEETPQTTVESWVTRASPMRGQTPEAPGPGGLGLGTVSLGVLPGPGQRAGLSLPRHTPTGLAREHSLSVHSG